MRVGPKAEFSVDEPMANSSRFVLPIITAPAASRCDCGQRKLSLSSIVTNRSTMSLAGRVKMSYLSVLALRIWLKPAGRPVLILASKLMTKVWPGAMFAML